MPSVFTPEREADLRARVARLSPEARAQFGTLNAPRMLCHLIDAYRNALGENPTPMRKSVLSNPLVRWLIIHVVPFPKGKAKTAPSFLATQPHDWAADVARWNELLTQIVTRGRDASPQWDVHPAFGVLSTGDWGALIYKHTDHHLRQLGV